MGQGQTGNGLAIVTIGRRAEAGRLRSMLEYKKEAPDSEEFGALLCCPGGAGCGGNVVTD